MEQIFGLILSACFGAIFGSYATLFAYRLPLNEPCFGRFFGPKSRCPKCNRIIKTSELIPLINWLVTLGRCKSCKTKIPRTHLFIELATTLSFILCYLEFGFNELFIIYALISVSLVILITIDYTHQIFTNSVLNFILTVGLANKVLQDGNIVGSVYSAVFGVICATIFYKLFYVKIKNLFIKQEQAFDSVKFILIASLLLQKSVFLHYFLSITLIFAIFSLFDIINKRRHKSLGYVLIIPFWLLLLKPPLFLIN